MRNGYRRLVAVLLALAMSLSLGLSAWAAEESSADAPEPCQEVLLPAEEPEEVPEEAPAPSEPEAESEAEQQEEPEEAPEELEEAPEEPEEAPEALEEVPEASGGEDVLTVQADLPDVSQDKNLIAEEEVFVCVGRKKSLKLSKAPESPAYFVSLDSQVVTTWKSGNSVYFKGEGVGKTKIEMRRSADNALLDTVTAYGFQPTNTKRAKGTNTREKPANLITSSPTSPTRTYRLICQQKQYDKSYQSSLSKHGCSICAVSTVCQAFGATKLTVDHLMTGTLEEIALRSGTRLKDHTLGYYGLQKVLEYGGISSSIFNWNNNSVASQEAAKEEMVRSLSAGHPVLLYLDQNSKWNNIGPLCTALHCVAVVGINDDGYVQILNSSYPHGVSYFKFNGSIRQVSLTPGELLDHFVRHSHMNRLVDDDFYFSKNGGLHTMLEVTCDSASDPKYTSIGTPSLSNTSYTYSGEACTPTVSIEGLTEGTDFRVVYSKNVNAGTATVTVAGLGSHNGLKRVNFTINKAPVTITASNHTLSVKNVQQTVKLGATASNNAKISYASSDKKVEVNGSGVVTVPSGYQGKVTFTLTTAESDNYKAASKTVTLKVKKGGEESESDDKDSGDKDDDGSKGSKSKSAGKVTASGKTVHSANKAQKVRLKAKAKGGAKLSFTSSDKKVKISSSGVAQVPKNYVGVVKVTIRSAATSRLRSAKKTIKLKVLPAGTRLTSVKPGEAGRSSVKWKADKSVTGYQLQYWSPGDQKGKVRTVTLKKQKTTSTTLKGLKAGATYKIRLRSYKKVSGTTLYSSWSGKKNLKVS